MRLTTSTFLLLAAMLAPVPLSAQTGGTFAPTGDMAEARDNHTATLLMDGRILIAGGTGEHRELATAELYDPATRTFAPTGRMSVPRGLHSATLLPDGKVLVVGGHALSSAELYDPATGMFKPVAAPIRARSNPSATLLRNGKVLIAGGQSPAPPWPTAVRAELYDLETGTFSLAGGYAGSGSLYPTAGGPISPTANLLPDGRVLITGDNRAEIYDPSTDTFSLTGRMVQGVYRYGMYWHSATSLKDGTVLVAGGQYEDSSCDGSTNAAELFHAASGTFNAAGRMTVAREVHAATLLQDGTVLLTGGGSGTCFQPTLESAELYVRGTNSFVAAGKMTRSRSFHTSTLLNDGTVLIAGGTSYWPRTTIASAEVYQSAKASQALTFTTFAGPEGGPGSEDGRGSSARFFTPAAVATDLRGNLYVADESNHTIQKITPDGEVTTLAGLAGSAGANDGHGSAARFKFPSGVATDLRGNVYVADSGNGTVRRITPDAVVTTFARMNGGEARPGGIATDQNGSVYVSDQRYATVLKITPDGVIRILAGRHDQVGKIDGTGSEARFNGPSGLAADSSGNIYVADVNNHAIRKITPAGVVTTLAGGFGTADGVGSAAGFQLPWGVATDSNGNVYVADAQNRTIRRVTSEGAVTTLAGLAGRSGSVDGTGNAARFNYPRGVATDSVGNVYVADWGSFFPKGGTIRKITPAGEVTTLAGREAGAGSVDGSRAAARFNEPAGVATDGTGNVYVADSENHTIRKITPDGEVTTIAGLAENRGSTDGPGSAARFSSPYGVAADRSGNVYVADTNNHTIRKVTPDGIVTTIAGRAGTWGSADGTGSAARFVLPRGIAVDSEGNIYVADTENHTIRKIAANGAVTTLAGLSGTLGAGSADGLGTEARFYAPRGVATDDRGNVYVADSGNHTIRKITSDGRVTTLAGAVGKAGSADGVGSAARFDFTGFDGSAFLDPIEFHGAVATDSTGNVYVADTNNATIRKITPDGEVTTMAGLAGNIGSAHGTGSAARFNGPRGVAVDHSGNVYVADTYNNKIRIGKAGLADAAIIDLAHGLTGTSRQLEASHRTATSWEWSVIRRPADSVAIFSSASVPNPTFTPDVPGLYTFRLIATGPGGSSITTVDLNVNPTLGGRRPGRRP